MHSLCWRNLRFLRCDTFVLFSFPLCRVVVKSFFFEKSVADHNVKRPSVENTEPPIVCPSIVPSGMSDWIGTDVTRRKPPTPQSNATTHRSNNNEPIDEQSLNKPPRSPLNDIVRATWMKRRSQIRVSVNEIA